MDELQWHNGDVAPPHAVLEDTARGGDHAEARMQSVDDSGRLVSYRWRSVSGFGNHQLFRTYVHDVAGVRQLRI